MVNSRPADWFGAEHSPLLLNYVRLLSMADKVSEQLAKFDPEWFEADSGPQRYKQLAATYVGITSAIKALAVTMRLTQQSVYTPQRAGTSSSRVRGGPKPWHSIEG